MIKMKSSAKSRSTRQKAGSAKEAHTTVGRQAVILSPFDIISRGMKVNPRITRILFPVIMVIACVAIIGLWRIDSGTAIIGGILVIIAAVILILVSAISASQLGTTAIWFSRFVALLFVVVLGTLFSSWAANFPKPPTCLLHPINPTPDCVFPVIAARSTESACLKADEKIPNGWCSNVNGEYVVTNVRWADPDRGLNVRLEPNVKGIVMGKLPPNASGIAVRDCSSGWCHVQCGALDGWASERYLNLRSNTVFEVKGLSNVATGLSARNGPDYTCSATESIPHDAKDVIIHSCEESPSAGSRWCLVTYKDHSGWVPLEYLSLQR